MSSISNYYKQVFNNLFEDNITLTSIIKSKQNNNYHLNYNLVNLNFLESYQQTLSFYNHIFKKIGKNKE